ncbi:MAG: glycoside-pentoside-hexuronide (GPH):cation symporter [Spirochaetes bacterium]|nr:glycoside-pentoside-hexuronide (GPH):cation symporter [Spirochaetota bacterium]MBU1080654.1 glycoside-pentoside-hexuronide (GPH):cation symporter [Spirochaetota bacterium]
MGTKKLSLRTKLGFGVCDLGGNLFFTAMGFWSLNYLTDVVALPAAAAGIAVMVAKLWDAVTDPMMGFVSDRTRTKMGRRRPYILWGAIPLFLAMWFFFTSPGLSNAFALTVWAIFALCLLNTAYTVVNIPYNSLTPELTEDFNERTSLNGFRFGFAVFGTMLGAGAVLPIVGLFPTKAAGFSGMGLVLGAVMAVTALITFFSVKEPDHSATEIPKDGFFHTYAAVFKNKPYVILLFTYALNLAGLTFMQGIIAYYFKYVYNNEGMTTLAMLALLVVAMVCIPISVLVSKKIGKKRTYQLAFFFIATACLLIFFFAHRLGINFFLGVMVWAGIGVGFGYVSPWAMIPDTVEYDAVRTGKRKEGAFYGMWTFMSKVGVSFAIVVSGLVLDLGGYVAHAAQGAGSILAIRLLIGVFPAVVLAAAIALVEFYPIDQKMYEGIMAEKAGLEADRAS